MAEGSSEVWFYHLERSSLDQVLPELLERTLARGWKAVVRTVGEERLEALDERLWTFRADSFLPHGRADRGEAERQPILLTTANDNANAAQALFIVDGAPMEDATAYQRCMVLFDGRDEEAVAEARRRWKMVKGSGAVIAYWKQDEDGRWAKAG